MPLGIERLNARRQQPNSRIVFIKPLPGPTAAYAQDFLERIAAIVHPVMKANHLSIMSLEEYAPNPEFVGRNFNAGEVVQLVLRSNVGGHWLGFRGVQMVMVHELAHCAQMNHSAAFWKVRNAFADELRALWAKDYTGDGFWGKGETLLSSQYGPVGDVGMETLPKSLCGGTFRSGRRGKRKRKGKTEGTTTLTYAERQQKRIARKFGVNGIQLGDDEETRVKLEDGKRPKGKPRVAGSARGRELRAAAALARFGTQKEEKTIKEEEENTQGDSSSEGESEYEGAEEGKEAIDIDGAQLLDGKGHALVKVCEDEDQEDAHVKREMAELHDLDAIPPHDQHPTKSEKPIKKEPPLLPRAAPPTSYNSPPPLSDPTPCAICSLLNPPSAPTCLACAHVLSPSTMPDHWRCDGPECAPSSAYVNAADCGVCGVCGRRRGEGRRGGGRRGERGGNSEYEGKVRGERNAALEQGERNGVQPR